MVIPFCVSWVHKDFFTRSGSSRFWSSTLPAWKGPWTSIRPLPLVFEGQGSSVCWIPVASRPIRSTPIDDADQTFNKAQFCFILGGDFKNKQTTKQLFEQEYNCSNNCLSYSYLWRNPPLFMKCTLNEKVQSQHRKKNRFYIRHNLTSPCSSNLHFLSNPKSQEKKTL